MYSEILKPDISEINPISQISNQGQSRIGPSQNNLPVPDEKSKQEAVGNPMLESKLKIDEYKQHQNANKQDISSSVHNLQNFYQEQMDGYTFDYRQSDHPTAALFHFGLKAFALAFYMFGGLFIREAWTIPEIVIVLGAIDFWVTKNVTGRLLVGLRWWEEIDEATEEQIWVFETRVSEQNVSKVNEGIFWVTMGLAVLAWGFLGVINILATNILNLLGIIFQFIMVSINFYFYFMCSRTAKKRAEQLGRVVGAELLKKMMNQSVIWPLKLPKAK